MILQFPECVAQQCTMVNVVNDNVDEPEEFFNFTLARTPGLDPRINLDPTEGQVVINDENKGKSSEVYFIQWNLSIPVTHIPTSPFIQLNDFCTCTYLGPGQVVSQCFTGTDCAGDQVPASNRRECCVETNTGLSYNDAGTCTECIGKY